MGGLISVMVPLQSRSLNSGGDMRVVRMGSLSVRSLCVGALLVTACRPNPDSPADVVAGLYAMLIDSAVTGAPTRPQLAAISPYLSAELRGLLDEAAALRDAEAAAHPDEKPPFAEGDLFTSLFEGPTGLAILASGDGAAERRVVVQFSDDRATPAVTWTDTVAIVEEAGRLVVADVVYGGTWDFANRGSLLETLHGNLHPPARPDWTLRLDGIGPVRVGMTLAEVERLLGGTTRIERIEPGDECGYAYLSAMPAGLSLMLAGDTVVRANVDTTGFRDAAGVAVGSAEADVLSRYQGRVRVEEHPYTGPEGHYLIVDDPARPGFRLIFETDGRMVTSFRGGRLPEVDLIEGCA